MSLFPFIFLGLMLVLFIFVIPFVASVIDLKREEKRENTAVRKEVHHG